VPCVYQFHHSPDFVAHRNVPVPCGVCSSHSCACRAQRAVPIRSRRKPAAIANVMPEGWLIAEARVPFTKTMLMMRATRPLSGS
jgi:hypothetical protein